MLKPARMSPWLKPRGRLRLRPPGVMRGLRGVLPFADAAFHGLGPVLGWAPSNLGSAVRDGASPYGAGVLFDGSTSVNNEIGYLIEGLTICSFEVLFLAGAGITNVSIMGANNAAAGSSTTQDKGLFFDGSADLTWYTFNGAPKSVVDTTTAYAANTLYHIVGTVGAGGQVLYLNGQSVGSDANTAATSFSPTHLCFGSLTIGNGSIARAGSGVVLFAAYANVQWSATEVLQRYEDVYGLVEGLDDRLFDWTLGIQVAAGGLSMPVAMHHRRQQRAA